MKFACRHFVGDAVSSVLRMMTGSFLGDSPRSAQSVGRFVLEVNVWQVLTGDLLPYCIEVDLVELCDL